MRKTLSVLFFFTLAGFLTAEPMVLTVDDAVEKGIANNRNLKIEESKLSTKKQAGKDAWNAFIPDVSVGTSLSRTNQESAPGLSPWTLAADVSAQLVLSPALGNGVRAIELDIQNSELSVETSLRAVSSGIRKTFYNLLLLQEQIVMLEQNMITTEKRLESVEEMYRNGLASELNVLNTRSSLSSLRPQMAKLSAAYEQALMKFRLDLGLELTQEITLQGKVDISPVVWDPEALIRENLAGRLDIQSLILNEGIIENARDALAAQKKLPSLVLSWGYKPYQIDPFTGDSWNNKRLSGDRGAFSVALSLPVDDWLPHSATNNEIDTRNDQLEQLRYQKELALKGAEIEIRSLVLNLNTSGENLAVLEESVSLNKENLSLTWASYYNGGVALLDLETAQNDLLQAQLNLLAEKYTYIVTLLDLEVAVNRSLLGSGDSTK